MLKEPQDVTAPTFGSFRVFSVTMLSSWEQSNKPTHTGTDMDAATRIQTVHLHQLCSLWMWPLPSVMNWSLSGIRTTVLVWANLLWNVLNKTHERWRLELVRERRKGRGGVVMHSVFPWRSSDLPVRVSFMWSAQAGLIRTPKGVCLLAVLILLSSQLSSCRIIILLIHILIFSCPHHSLELLRNTEEFEYSSYTVYWIHKQIPYPL